MWGASTFVTEMIILVLMHYRCTGDLGKSTTYVTYNKTTSKTPEGWTRTFSVGSTVASLRLFCHHEGWIVYRGCPRQEVTVGVLVVQSRARVMEESNHAGQSKLYIPPGRIVYESVSVGKKQTQVRTCVSKDPECSMDSPSSWCTWKRRSITKEASSSLWTGLICQRPLFFAHAKAWSHMALGVGNPFPKINPQRSDIQLK